LADPGDPLMFDSYQHILGSRRGSTADGERGALGTRDVGRADHHTRKSVRSASEARTRLGAEAYVEAIHSEEGAARDTEQVNPRQRSHVSPHQRAPFIRSKLNRANDPTPNHV